MPRGQFAPTFSVVGVFRSRGSSCTSTRLQQPQLSRQLVFLMCRTRWHPTSEAVFASPYIRLPTSTLYSGTWAETPPTPHMSMSSAEATLADAVILWVKTQPPRVESNKKSSFQPDYLTGLDTTRSIHDTVETMQTPLTKQNEPIKDRIRQAKRTISKGHNLFTAAQSRSQASGWSIMMESHNS